MQHIPELAELDEFRKQILDLRSTIISKEQERNELLQRDKQLLEEIDRLQTQKLILRQQLHQHLHTNEVNLNSLRQRYERALVEYRLKLESIVFHKQ
jgi:chromosome segregation ATPase